MPRPKRLCIPGLPHHVVQRGNDRQATFYNHDDFAMYVTLLNEAAINHAVSIHAYALMTNHVHLLLTPAATNGLSLVIQSLGRRYVTYINKTYRRTGTLWERRFKSSVVDNEAYCLACYQYIELNPVRAGIVTKPEDYRWNSYRSNALGSADQLITPHLIYNDLAPTVAERREQYRLLVHRGLNADVVEQIRYGTRKGLPVGNDRFKADIEKQLGRRLTTRQVGRPRKE